MDMKPDMKKPFDTKSDIKPVQTKPSAQPAKPLDIKGVDSKKVTPPAKPAMQAKPGGAR